MTINILLNSCQKREGFRTYVQLHPQFSYVESVSSSLFLLPVDFSGHQDGSEPGHIAAHAAVIVVTLDTNLRGQRETMGDLLTSRDVDRNSCRARARERSGVNRLTSGTLRGAASPVNSNSIGGHNQRTVRREPHSNVRIGPLRTACSPTRSGDQKPYS